MSDESINHDLTIKEQVAQVLKKIRPAIQADGGDIELVDVTSEGVVKVRFMGACIGCPSSSMTLKSGIERNICHHIPEIKEVIAVP